MENKTFGNMIFNTGWKTNRDVVFFDKTFSVIIKAKAYFEKDGITAAQESSFREYSDNSDEKLSTIERLLTDFSGENASMRFIPRMILFERNGDYAMLLDDMDAPDEGIAATLFPKEEIISQDEYL